MPASSAIGMNSSGRHRAQLRVVPAQQRLGADRPHRRQRDHRLEDQAQLVALDRAAQLVLQRGAPAQQLVVGARRSARPGSCRAAWRTRSARSALRSSELGSSGSPAQPARPMLADRKTVPPRWSYGRLEHARAAARRPASASAGRPHISTANSSPPSRAARSPGRRLSRSRWPTSISTASPTSWPRMSLTFLKPSRSRRAARRARPASASLRTAPAAGRAGWPARSAGRCAPARGSAPRCSASRLRVAAAGRRRARYCRATRAKPSTLPATMPDRVEAGRPAARW